MRETPACHPDGWINIREQTSSGSPWVCVRACVSLSYAQLFRSALLRGSSRISSITRVRHVNTCSRRLPIPGAISFVKLVLHTQGKIDCYVVGFFFFVILMSNLMTFCFYYVHVLNFMRVFMNLFIYANFHFHGSICLCEILFNFATKFSSLYFCCFLFSLFTKKFPQFSLQRVSDDGRTETCRNTCIKYRRTRESWKICFTWAIFFFSTRFRYWRKNCMRYELLVVNHASGLRRSHGSRKDWLNSTKNIFTSVLAIILEITKEQ